jgi:hypothetical protein
LLPKGDPNRLSLNKAAIQANFRPPPPTPFEQVQKLLPKLTADGLRRTAG